MLYDCLDYDIGNLRSVQKALEHVGAEVTLTSDPEVIVAADKVVLPGVGTFGDRMKGMKARDEESEEHGRHADLGILSGRVKRFEPDPEQKALKVPQTGWNEIKVQRPSPLFHDLPQVAMAMWSASPNQGLELTASSLRCAAVVHATSPS